MSGTSQVLRKYSFIKCYFTLNKACNSALCVPLFVGYYTYFFCTWDIIKLSNFNLSSYQYGRSMPPYNIDFSKNFMEETIFFQSSHQTQMTMRDRGAVTGNGFPIHVLIKVGLIGLFHYGSKEDYCLDVCWDYWLLPECLSVEREPYTSQSHGQPIPLVLISSPDIHSNHHHRQNPVG